MKTKNRLAEFIGTYALCFVAILAIHHLGSAPGGLFGIAFANGLVIASFATAFGTVSGAHFNPAVTIAMWLTNRMKAVDVPSYILSQIGGAIFAGLTIKFLGMDNSVVGNGTPAPAESVSMIQAIVAEAVGTFFMVAVIFGTAVDSRAPKNGALNIGWSIVVSIIAIGPISGAAMNPARWFGPALVSGKGLSNIVIFSVGPILGALLAAFLYDLFFKPEPSE